MNPQTIIQLQNSLGVPATGVFDSNTLSAMSRAVSKAVAANPEVRKYAGGNSADTILNAYQTGDWSGVSSLNGTPFSPTQQKAAVAEATKALAPAYKAQEQYDTANAQDALGNIQREYSDFEDEQGRQFGKDKDALDQSAATNGTLYSGSRVKGLSDLATDYRTADERERAAEASGISSAARNYQYQYGNGNADSLSSYYRLPGASSYNPNVAGGKVTSSPLSSVYNPSAYTFQGTQPVAQKAAIQTRAAGILANKANKLALTGYKNQF